MQLKQYQQNTLDILKRYFQECRIAGAKAAFEKITNESDIKSRLGPLFSTYEEWPAIQNTPRICLKVPTGGGKTIIAAHTIKIVSETWLERDFPVVLWFTPSDLIRKQTAEALKNPRHPYREALDGQFEGKVRIFDLDEKFNITKNDVENNAVIIVATSQSFVKDDTAKYNVYRNNESLWDNFAEIICNTQGLETDENGKIKHSFANVLHHFHPIMIVDEAHKMLTTLTQEAFRRISPAAIIELTATPNPDGKEKDKCNNILYSVSARELKDEEMIKLPIVIREHKEGWEQAVDAAIIRRAELEKLAEQEKEYIRPIVLFQAQNINGEVNVNVLKKYLVETANLPEKEIAIATGDQKELDGINLFEKACPIRYIITVEALKEGWDCSFAYVLCSLANVGSKTSVIQLLGRVMRMPFAQARKNIELNKAYANVMSKAFSGNTTQELVEGLKNKGFEDEEARSSVIVEQELFNPIDTSINKVQITNELITFNLPASIKYDEKTKSIELSEATTEEDIEIVCRQETEEKAVEIRQKFTFLKNRAEIPTPAKSGERFSIPRLMVEIQGELEFADSETIFEYFDWNLADLASPKLAPQEFNIEDENNDFKIDIDGNKLVYSVETAVQQVLFANVEGWTKNSFVMWLDKALQQPDIQRMQMLDFVRKTVEYLISERSFTVEQLVLAKYALANKLQSKIANARQTARNTAFTQCLFSPEIKKEVDFNYTFEFQENMYDDQLFQQSTYQFTKHYLGKYKVPMIDGGEKGEEFACAKAIDVLIEVKFWLRNVARHPNSFWLPTATDKFYPDFVAMLTDGRILLVEYKGEHLRGTDDVKEKQLVGELWERESNGTGLFLMAWKNENGKNVAEQLKDKIKQ
ncbi:MAG: DEAD/DEAH box helicase family protein [Prevotellaceae bacterium]|jgi:type III restriction enzyme|nr:DEAD/DEAH box helicase family protein [Prevotellaceae bacterium]